MESSPSAASCRSSQPPTKVMLDIALVTDISVSMGGPTSQPSSTKAWVRTAMPEKSTQNRDPPVLRIVAASAAYSSGPGTILG